MSTQHARDPLSKPSLLARATDEPAAQQITVRLVLLIIRQLARQRELADQGERVDHRGGGARTCERVDAEQRQDQRIERRRNIERKTRRGRRRLPPQLRQVLDMPRRKRRLTRQREIRDDAEPKQVRALIEGVQCGAAAALGCGTLRTRATADRNFGNSLGGNVSPP
jgi:hypothetical protein